MTVNGENKVKQRVQWFRFMCEGKKILQVKHVCITMQYDSNCS
jgi:hypothetical protein